MEFQDFDKVIEKFKEPYLLNKYNKRNCIILEKFIKILKEQKNNLTKILNEENKEWGLNYNIDKFYKIIEQYENMQKTKGSKFGIGNIIAIEIENPNLVLELIFKTILSNSRVIITTDTNMIGFNLYVISIIQEVLKEENLDETLISMVNITDYKAKILDNQEIIDCIIVNRDYDEYYYFVANTSIKSIYLDYGNINVYTDGEDEEIVNKIIDIANDNDMDVYTYDINDLEDFLRNNRNNVIYNTAIIISKDLKKCMKLYEIIKARNIFINQFNIDEIEIGLDINDLQFEKKIFIKK